MELPTTEGNSPVGENTRNSFPSQAQLLSNKTLTMVLQVYGWPPSTCTRTVLVTLKEKNVPYEFHNVELTKGEHKAPDYVKNQPFGQVPYINDDGFILYESRAIARYIATKYKDQGTPLIPTDLKKYAKFEQGAALETSAFNPYTTKIVAERLLKKIFNAGEPDESVVSANVASLEKSLDIYEDILSKQKYIGGDEFSLADIQHLGYGLYLGACGVNLLEDPKRPNLNRWWKDITSRPSWKEVSA
jgi:glutathione S-transferase